MAAEVNLPSSKVSTGRLDRRSGDKIDNMVPSKVYCLDVYN
jgi:hypothetical protein